MTSNKSVLEQNTAGVPKFVPLLIGLLVVGLITLILLTRMSPRNTQLEYEFVQATEVLTANQDMTIAVENITIYIPKYSVNLPGTVSVVSQEPNLFPAADQPEWARPQIIEVLFLNTQATPVPGIIFSNPVQVCFTISPEQWQDFTQRPDAYQVQYYGVENNPPAWQSLPMTPHDDLSMLCGATMHFSLFALAIRSDDSIPVTGLTPTPTTTTTLSLTAPGIRRTPIRTNPPPENTLISPSATWPPPTSTRPPSTNTQPPATATQAPSATAEPPTVSPPTETEPPPIDTPEPPDPTPTEDEAPPAETETPSAGILPLPALSCLLLCP